MLSRMNTASMTAEILAVDGWTQARLAGEIGVSQPTVARWAKGADPEGPNRDKLRDIHARVVKRPALVKSFDPDAPDAPDRDDEMTVGEHTGAQGVPSGSIPQIDVTAGMGGGGITIVRDGVAGKGGMTFSAEVVRDFWRIPTEVLRSVGASPDFLAVLPVQGDSMQPTLHDGEWVVADTRHRWPSPDGIYALNDAFGGVVVKRLEVISKPSDEVQRVKVISDNARHAPKEWDFEELRIIGRVIWRFGNLQ
jgi:transcriptional regulator with XRE-family HTH domain